MSTKSVTSNTEYNLDHGLSPDLFPNVRGASDPVFLASPGKPSAGGYPLPAFVAVAVGRPRRAPRDVIGVPTWRSIVSVIALVIATGARWSIRWLRAFASGDQIFFSLRLASTASSPAVSSAPCVPDHPGASLSVHGRTAARPADALPQT